MNTSYSEEIVSAIKNFLEQGGWNYTFDEKKGRFTFGLNLKCKLKNVRYIVVVYEEDYNVYALSSLGAGEDDYDILAKMSEFVNRANYGIRNGNFELDMSDGEIRYKTYVDCHGGLVPTNEMIERSVCAPAAMFERYGNGIAKVIFGDVSAEDAIAECEGV